MSHRLSNGAMKVIGLTGSIGTGKGEVAAVLRSLGAQVIEADEVGHQVYQRGTEGWRRVVEIFGREVLDTSERVDRQRLGEVVFSDPKALSRLNAALHPLIREGVLSELKAIEGGGAEVAVVAAALLLEAGWRDLVDEVWVVWAPEAVVMRRARRQRGLTTAQVRQRLRAQSPPEWQLQQADVTIENAGDLGELRRQVEELWQERLSGKDS